MRNKGFFWFLTILLSAVCVYQLSFTFVSNSVENKAAKTAELELNEYREKAKATGDSIVVYGSMIHFDSPEGEENAKAAIINNILKSKAETKVYPLLGSTFSEVKKKSLAFGLDLVGGMSVTMEIDIPGLVKYYARSERDAAFVRVHNAAEKEYNTKGGNYFQIFARKNKELNNGNALVKLFDVTENDGIDIKSTDDQVIAFLQEKLDASMGGVEEIINRRINQFGVSQPNIQRDEANNRLYIELPGVQDEKTVVDQLQTTANLEFFELYSMQDIEGYWSKANELSLKPMKTLEELEAEEADSTVATTDSSSVKDTTEAVATLDGSTESSLNSLDSGAEVKGLSQLAVMAGPFQFFAKDKDREAVNALLKREDISRVFNDDVKFMWSADLEKGGNNQLGYYLYVIKVPADGKARVSGKDIAKANPDINEKGQRTVSLKMTDDGADKWNLMTSENIGRAVAVTMDNLVFSAPTVNEAIPNGSTEISGNFTFDQTQQLSSLLNGGALPAPCVIKEQFKVGPTIGADNSRAGLISFGIALVLVFIYMIFYYGKAGIVADIALIANILFIFGTLASFSAVLTLAGIAGIVLTIGMAVDANVLIFERIREEEAAGKDKKSAIETGFKKALSSIIDANVTTLLTAIVLKVFGSGPIESFATTLIIGIFTSMFAALVITRLIVTRFIDKGKSIEFDTKLTKGAFKNFNIDFVNKRKVFYALSSVLVIISLVGIFTKGLNPSVEFSGGRSYTVKFDKSVESQIGLLESNIKKSFGKEGEKASLITKTKSNSYTVDITTNFMLEKSDTSGIVQRKLEAAFESSKAELGAYKILESRSVSGTISDELKTSSMLSIGLSLIIIFAYIMLRFGKWQYSMSAIMALAHDVTIILGLFALLSGIMPFTMDVDQAFIAAILTVIGYSINDTVIVYDRIRENFGMLSGKTQAEEINQSLNSTLSRTINTSMTTIIVLLIIFLFGGAAIKGFIFALLIGVVVGTYSSVCIATPLLIDLSKKIKA